MIRREGENYEWSSTWNIINHHVHCVHLGCNFVQEYYPEDASYPILSTLNCSIMLLQVRTTRAPTIMRMPAAILFHPVVLCCVLLQVWTKPRLSWGCQLSYSILNYCVSAGSDYPGPDYPEDASSYPISSCCVVLCCRFGLSPDYLEDASYPIPSWTIVFLQVRTTLVPTIQRMPAAIRFHPVVLCCVAGLD